MKVTRDLIVVLADIDAQNAIQGIFARHQSLKTIPLEIGNNVKIDKHPERDNGCCSGGVNYLRPYHGLFRHALLIFDRHGSGRDMDSASVIEEDLDQCLENNGWVGGRAKAVVIEPELENWVWSQSVHVASALGKSSHPDLKNWLEKEGWLEPGETKPKMPKEALHAAYGKQPKARFFNDLASKVSFKDCQDRAFNRLLTTLRTWFPASPPEVHP